MQDEPLRRISKYVSPDGALTFVVVTEDGDSCIGFEGYFSHTHGDMIATMYGLPEEEAEDWYAGAVLNGEFAIESMIVNGKVLEVRVVELPLRGDPWGREEDETFVYRLWGGTILAAYGPEAPASGQ